MFAIIGLHEWCPKTGCHVEVRGLPPAITSSNNVPQCIIIADTHMLTEYMWFVGLLFETLDPRLKMFKFQS